MAYHVQALLYCALLSATVPKGVPTWCSLPVQASHFYFGRTFLFIECVHGHLECAFCMRWEAASKYLKQVNLYLLAKYVAGRFHDRELGELVYVHGCDSASKDKYGVSLFFLALVFSHAVAAIRALSRWSVGNSGGLVRFGLQRVLLHLAICHSKALQRNSERNTFRRLNFLSICFDYNTLRWCSTLFNRCCCSSKKKYAVMRLNF